MTTDADRIAAALALHRESPDWGGPWDTPYPLCAGCDHKYPCPTVKALDPAHDDTANRLRGTMQPKGGA